MIDLREEDEHHYTVHVRQPTWRERWLDWVAWLERWYRITRWWRPRYVTSSIDVDRGMVTMSAEFWSWRRWRWERRP